MSGAERGAERGVNGVTSAMARQWRIEFPGTIYHVLSRGNRRQDIFRSGDDRRLFLELIGQVSERFDIEVHTYVLMGNHYHLLHKTREANLSKAMQWLGTTYTRRFNFKNGHCGHLFQGRFKSIIVEKVVYLLWKTGRFSNKQIGNMMGVTYSTVSKIISAFDDRIKTDCQLQARYDTLNSLFKLTPVTPSRPAQ